MADREKVIEGLEKVWDAFNHMEHELYADYVFDALELLKAQEPKKRESRAMLPCKCGGVRREHWVAPDNELCEELRCKKCGFTVAGKNQTDVIRRWNEAVKRND